jgi:5-hydroxyisourate hydrolase
VTLSTHVLDTARGVPAEGIAISLFTLDGNNRLLIAEAVTNADGRTNVPLSVALAPGLYELNFFVGSYFDEHSQSAFYDEIPIRFRLTAAASRYHVPLLLAPWGYSTYRGS